MSSDNEVPVVPRLSSPDGAENDTYGEELKMPMRANAFPVAAPSDDAWETLASTRTESNSAPLADSEYTLLAFPFSSAACEMAETSCGPA